jgi:DNA polymerase III sliding clamp (beta) subunit (PCNA family)
LSLPALTAVAASAGKDKLCQVVSGDHGLHLHTTDNYRLTRAALPEAGFGPFSGLLRIGVLEQIARAHASAVQVDPRGRVIAAYGERVTIVTRLVDERFPSVGTILDAVPPYSTALPSADLRQKLARLAAVTEAGRPLRVEVDGDRMLLDMDSSVNLGAGDEHVALTAPVAVPLTFGVNLDYLARAADSLPAEQLTLSWEASDRPIFLSVTDPLPITSVIMPIKL